MANTFDNAFISQFSDNIIYAAQQRGSKLRNLVRCEDVNGKDAYFDTVGASYASSMTSAAGNATGGAAAHPDSPVADTQFNKRKVTLAGYNWGDMVDNIDRVRSLLDPTSAFLTVGAQAMGRQMDAVIVDALIGSAATGPTGGTAVALPSGQKVAVDLEASGTNTNLTLAKLLQTKYIFDAADVDPDLPRYFLTTASQLKGLLNATEIKSADYNTVKALATGQLNTFLGFEFIQLNGLRAASTPIMPKSSNTRKNIAFVGGPLGGAILGCGIDPVAKVAERADKSFATQVYFEMLLGAVRAQEEFVVEISCDETK